MSTPTGSHSIASPFTATGEGQRHAIYAEYARAGSVHRIAMPTGVPLWLVTGHEEARSLLTDPRLVKGGWEARARWSPPGSRLPPDVARGLHTHMLTADPPDHGRLRRLAAQAFTRRRIDALEPRIRALTAELLGALDGDDEADLVASLAYPLPIAVITELVGIPEEGREDFRGWAVPLMAPGIVSPEVAAAAAGKLHGYTRELIARKRRSPEDDLLSDLIAARDGGDRLSGDELTSMVYLLVFAGHETTVNLIANGVLALLANPDQLALVRAEPDRLADAIEELLRYDGPVQGTLPYLTVEPVDVGGVTIPADELVMISLLAANRDPARFPGGDRLDVTRPAGAHLAFGHGLHYCLGAPLARLQGQIAIGALLDRFPALRLGEPAETLTRSPSMIVNSLTALPVRLR
ncbi:cytochrome P450 family protein [Plantactinospora sp. WMMB334]|uniref:cytochrome P450 family protein n=1 Tax=Plantactinospora sp. WMMB334 TaxID=3404119 RepID=UPI003B950C6A